MSDSTKRFSNRVNDYVKYRPSYPSELVDVLKQEGILKPDSIIADIGSGTGIFTKLLLETGSQVYAVEPNTEMRLAAEKFLDKYSNLTSIEGQAETTTLPDNCVNIVTVAQAFHWFDRVKTRQEFLRILQPNGFVVLVWNDRIKDNNPFLKGYNELLLKFCPEHEVTNHYKITDEQITEFYGLVEVKKFVTTYSQKFNFEGLKGRLRSSSYAPKEDDLRYKPMMTALKALFDTHQEEDQITFEYKTKMYYGELLPTTQK